MNEQLSLAYSVQPDGTVSYALSVIPENGEIRSINLCSLGANEVDHAFISAMQTAITDYRASKEF